MVGTDPAAVKARRAGLPVCVEEDLCGHSQALDARSEAAGVRRQRQRQHRLNGARHVDARCAPLRPRHRARCPGGRALRHRRYESTDGCRHPPVDAETASSKSRAVTGSTVNVSSAVRSRRVGSITRPRTAPSPAPRPRSPRRTPAHAGAPRSAPMATSRAISGSPRSARTRAPLPRRSTRTIWPTWARTGPPARPSWSPGSNSGSATRKRPRLRTTATKLSDSFTRLIRRRSRR